MDNEILSVFLAFVVLSEELHAHNGKNEDDNAEYKRQVTQGAHRFTHDGYKQVESGPGFGQFEHSQLHTYTYKLVQMIPVSRSL